jgi:hypothetical protein
MVNKNMRILLLVLLVLSTLCCSSSILRMENGLVSADLRPTSLAGLIAANDYLISSSRLGDSSFAYLFDSVRNATSRHIIRTWLPYSPTPNFSMHLASADSVQIACFDVRNNPVGMPLRLFLEQGDYRYTVVSSRDRSGVYYCECTIGKTTWWKKKILLVP